MSRENIAKIACNIEIIKMKQPIGMQDQYCAAYGGFNYINFYNNKVTVNKILLNAKRLNEFKNSLILVSTGLTRSSKKILKSVKKNKNIKIIKNIVKLVDNFKYELHNGNLNNLGKILHENWIKKKELSKHISNDYLDNLYNYAISQGAIGGKLLGAGGGGFFLFLINKNYKENFLKKMNKFKILNFDFYNSGSQIIYND